MMVAQRCQLEGPALFRHPLAAAVISTVVERGYEAASVEEIVARAGVERSEFDRLFNGKGDAVLRVFEASIDDFQREVGHAFESSAEWPANLRAAAYAIFRWIREHGEATQFGLVSVLDADEMTRVKREGLFRWCAGLIDAGRAVSPDPDSVPRGAPLMAVGATTEVLSRLVQGTLDLDREEIVPQMMYGAVRPYLGEEAARRELTIPPPPDLAQLDD